MKILKFIVILTLPLLLSNCAKEEIESAGLKDKLIGHWQTNEIDNETFNYSFTKEGKFAYWYTYRYDDGTNDPNPRGDLTGEWTVFGENEIGLTYTVLSTFYDRDVTRHEIVTVILTGDDKVEILDFSGDLRTYYKL